MRSLHTGDYKEIAQKMQNTFLQRFHKLFASSDAHLLQFATELIHYSVSSLDESSASSDIMKVTVRSEVLSLHTFFCDQLNVKFLT